jgi:hypothetical protein
MLEPAGLQSDEWLCKDATMDTTHPTPFLDLEIFRSGRSLQLDALAMEQAILNSANETEMVEEDAALLNKASFRNRGERNFFKNQYRRHARNIAQGSCFYS